MTQTAARLLQRVYGITFPDQAAMKDYQHRMEEAKRRDHRNIGTQQELFFFDRMSPGSCFFQPNGARIYNTLVEVGLEPRMILCSHSVLQRMMLRYSYAQLHMHSSGERGKMRAEATCAMFHGNAAQREASAGA